MKVVALVGMPGSGKSEVARVFQKRGYASVRFGDITDEEVRKRGLKLDEENERLVREDLRQQHGMAAYAILNLPRIEAALEKSSVVIDGLYSWEEYKYLKGRLGGRLHVVAVWAPPEVRYARLKGRAVRPLTPAQAGERDYAEIENVNKGGPIAMADHTIVNNGTLEALRQQAGSIIEVLK
ncbi:MAG: AAA family ATPase [Dehalococcoidia bacterium]|nr:AAA family ATPase [Dehalococcoidia bacterium]